jgi:hypothetical protein
MDPRARGQPASSNPYAEPSHPCGHVPHEPWALSGCGYPNLLATGEIWDGDSIHNRQHPHDLFMELLPLINGLSALFLSVTPRRHTM